MVRAALAILALVSGAFATSFSLDRLNSLKLHKRQTLSGDATQQVQGLLELAQQVLTDAQTGNITSACSTWAGSLSQCESTSGQNQVALASCACGSSILDQLDRCASSYATGSSAASGFNDFCRTTLPSVAQSGLTSTVGPSSTSMASSSLPSAISSSASSILSAVSSVASSVQSTTPSSGSNETSGTSRNIAMGASLSILTFGAIIFV
ncbi:uncharacterized protein JCM6883_001826 [Sporobolomyces salmoneus]|uniref:uncharacterized protein n=1 Tax=Sporobolomyces salmoneus TaxID=183962 RepID=UPI00316F16C4